MLVALPPAVIPAYPASFSPRTGETVTIVGNEVWVSPGAPASVSKGFHSLRGVFPVVRLPEVLGARC